MKVIAAAAATALVLVATASAGGSAAVPLGPATHASHAEFVGYYDGHKDLYFATDTSSKAQAKAMHINFSAAIRGAKKAPRQFFIEGKQAKGQLSVFGSEPGESDYNPLWDEIVVRWKASATPVLLVRDDQIDSLAKKGKLTETDIHVVLNAPIIKVG